MHSLLYTFMNLENVLLAYTLYEILGCVIHILQDFLLDIDTITKFSAFVCLVLVQHCFPGFLS